MKDFLEYEVEEDFFFYEEFEENESSDDTGKSLSEKVKTEENVRIDPDKALVLSMNEFSRPDIPYMVQRTGMKRRELVKALNLYQDPMAYDGHRDKDKDWFTVDMYLRGNRYLLLKQAKAMEKKYGGFKRNIQLLESSLPERVSLEDIHIPLGSKEVPGYYYGEFIRDLLKMNGVPKVTYDTKREKWQISEEYVADWMYNHCIFGTERMSALRIIKNTMNLIPIKVRDAVRRYDSDKVDYIVNEEETLAAQEKQNDIILAFRMWIFEDPARVERIQNNYCEKYCGYERTEFDGSYLMLEDLNQDLTLYDHQKKGVARILLTPNTMLVYNTGSGKTYTMVTAAHELLRMNLAKKILFVIPNAVFDTFVNAHKYAYPKDADKLMVIYPKQFRAGRREKYLDKISGEDFKGIIYMASSSYNSLTMTKEYYINKKQVEIDECKKLLETAFLSEEKKTLERKIRKLVNELTELILRIKNTETACFDRLGIDALFVDEAHLYKNLTIDCRLENVVGIHTQGSAKCDEHLEKVRHVQGKGGKVVFATATPLKNSLCDCYVMMKYLLPDELEYLQIQNFNDWVSVFCDSQVDFEIAVDSCNYRNVTRLKFHNLPELMSIFSTVADFYRSDENLNLPEFEGYTNITLKKSKEQEECYKKIAARLEDVHLHIISRKEFNELLACMAGRNCSTDIRLLYPEVIPIPGTTKIDVCSGMLKKIYHEYPGTSQIVFCDTSVPKAGFNVYDQMKKELIRLGIPEEEIAFIHDGDTDVKRRQLLEDLDNAKIRIMIGSTMKLGIGVNVQSHLIACHHMDIAWSAADMEQREGRILRQGNQNSKVMIFRYVTEGSFDAYIYQMLENKAKFITDFLSSGLNPTHRSEMDISDVVLNYAEVKALALGNELLKKRVEVSNELGRLKIAERQYKKQLMELQKVLLDTPEAILQCKMLITALKRDIQDFKEYREKVSMEEREDFGADLLAALKEHVGKEKEKVFDWYQGFEVVLPKYMKEENPYVLLRGTGAYRVILREAKTIGCSMRMDRLLESLPKRLKQQKEKLASLQNQLKEARIKISEGNPYSSQVEKAEMMLEMIDEKLENAS